MYATHKQRSIKCILPKEHPEKAEITKHYKSIASEHIIILRMKLHPQLVAVRQKHCLCHETALQSLLVRYFHI